MIQKSIVSYLSLYFKRSLLPYLIYIVFSKSFFLDQFDDVRRKLKEQYPNWFPNISPLRKLRNILRNYEAYSVSIRQANQFVIGFA